ncbi:hypothetical protein ACFVJH_01735 [Streptomyces decoyicus]|uniref:hypothetical protein n=1 Tax=Streptomyces decoyicus TaxID=249567 RepID=UPI00362FEAB8
MPDLRRLLSVWTARSTELEDPHLTPGLRKDLVERLADQYLRAGQWKELAALADEWSANTTTMTRSAAAIHALTYGLENKQYGGSFRQLIYTWCRDKQLMGNLAYVLLRVCTDVIAPTHPGQAMVRLRHLARRESGATPAMDACAIWWRQAAGSGAACSTASRGIRRPRPTTPGSSCGSATRCR